MSGNQLPWMEGLKSGDRVYCTTAAPDGSPVWVEGVAVRRQSVNIWWVKIKGEEHMCHVADMRLVTWCKSLPNPWWACNKGRWR